MNLNKVMDRLAANTAAGLNAKYGKAEAKKAKYEVIAARSWLRNDGARASLYGAVPYTSEAEKARWKVVEDGWTVYNPLTGEIGTGRKAFKTKEEAEAFVESVGYCSAIRMGD